MIDPINVGRGIGLRLETSTEGLDMGRYPRARLWPVGGQVLSAFQSVSPPASDAML